MWVKSFRQPGKVSPPDALALSSSCVQLAPGQRVGEHVTEGREEMLFVLQGVATVIAGGAATTVPAVSAAYVPPGTRHDVANETPWPLTYVYVTAKVPGGPGKP